GSAGCTRSLAGVCIRAGRDRPHSVPLSASSSAPFGGGREQRGDGAAQGLEAVEPDLLARPRALHHTAQPAGVVVPEAHDEGRVLAKVLWRLHPLAPVVMTHACLCSRDRCTRSSVSESCPAAW